MSGGVDKIFWKCDSCGLEIWRGREMAGTPVHHRCIGRTYTVGLGDVVYCAIKLLRLDRLLRIEAKKCGSCSTRRQWLNKLLTIQTNKHNWFVLAIGQWGQK